MNVESLFTKIGGLVVALDQANARIAELEARLGKVCVCTADSPADPALCCYAEPSCDDCPIRPEMSE